MIARFGDNLISWAEINDRTRRSVASNELKDFMKMESCDAREHELENGPYASLDLRRRIDRKFKPAKHLDAGFWLSRLMTRNPSRKEE
jgi:hypothetical protein